MRCVVIHKYGNTGNNMMEHMLAVCLKKELHPLEVNIYSNDTDLLKIFGFTLNKEPTHKHEKIINITNSKTSINELLANLRKYTNIQINVRYNLFDIIKYSKFLNEYKIFYGNKIKINGFNEKYLVINVRLGDIADKNHKTHPNYPVIPFSFHKYLIKKTQLVPVFIGQLDDGYITKNLIKTFPFAIFVKSRGILEDFECLRKSKNLSVAVSTFSFLAGFLSNEDTIVHVPLFGLFNPHDRPDLNYVIKNNRFNYYVFPKIVWNNSDEQIENVIKNDEKNYVKIT